MQLGVELVVLTAQLNVPDDRNAAAMGLGSSSSLLHDSQA
jgi:hypothetical protein